MNHGLSHKTVSALHRVFRNHSEIRKVVLYGSRAKGDFKNGSDIDIVLEAPSWHIRDLLRLENELDDLLLPYKLDIALSHQIDNEQLKEHIRRVGVVFYERDTVEDTSKE